MAFNSTAGMDMKMQETHLENNTTSLNGIIIGQGWKTGVENHVGDDAVRYGLDKVEFVSKKNAPVVTNEVRKLRPIRKNIGQVKVKEITKEQNHNKQYHYDRKAYDQGYRTITILTNISPELLDLLKQKTTEAIIGKPWQVEIFQDIVCANNDEAVRVTNALIKVVYMLYQEEQPFEFNRQNLFAQVRTLPSRKNIKKYKEWLWQIYRRQNFSKKDIIGDITLYLGIKGKFSFVLYARLSKKDKKPAVHSEFRICGRYITKLLKIRKKNSSYFDTLKNVTLLRSAEIYKTLAGKFIKCHEINGFKLARFHLGWSDKKKFTISEQRKMELYEKMLRRSYRLKNTSDYMYYFKKYKLDYRLFLVEVS